MLHWNVGRTDILQNEFEMELVHGESQYPSGTGYVHSQIDALRIG